MESCNKMQFCYFVFSKLNPECGTNYDDSWLPPVGRTIFELLSLKEKNLF
jgi:hypothetical protein